MQRHEQVIEQSKGFYQNGDPSHDFAHIQRVLKVCEKIGRAEGANLELLYCAAALHDIVNLPKDHPERAQASAMAAARSEAILQAAGFAEAEIAYIRSIITEHSYSRGNRPSTIESAILQDADRLDALGAIGIMRAVSCGCRLGAAYYDIAEPFAEGRALDDKAFTVDHFFTKLFKLPDLMNTALGKTEAQKRANFMQDFLQQLKTEIS